MAVEKLSQIASGGAFTPSTDVMVTVRSGATDLLTTLPTATSSILGIVKPDNTTITISGGIISSSGGGGGAGVSITNVTNGSPYTATAAAGFNIFTIYNTSGSAYTFNLPSSPATSSSVVVVDAGLTAGAHTITVQGNGNTISAYGSTASSAGIASNGGSISLAWDETQWTQYA